MGSDFSGRKVQTTFEKEIVFITDDMKSVGVVHSFLGGVLGIGANSLAQTSNLVAVGRVPRLGQAGVTAHCAIF